MLQGNQHGPRRPPLRGDSPLIDDALAHSDPTLHHAVPAAPPAHHPPAEREYTLVEKIGEGTYGVVYKARDTVTRKLVALKRIRFDHDDQGVPATALREVALLLDLKHPNIVPLLEVKYAARQLHLVFEYVDMDLKVLLDKNAHKPLHPRLTQSLTCQLLRALDYCHAHRVLHRDLKPQNILVSHDYTLKLADFGLARAFNLPMRVYTHEVVTLWYRPPEILLGSKRYSFGVDMWSAGCILLEMLAGKAVFPGDSEIDQLFKVFMLRGTPSADVWRGVADLPDYSHQFPQWRAKPLESVLPPGTLEAEAAMQPPGDAAAPVPSTALALHLVDNCLRYDPNDRYSARFALSHPYLEGVVVPPVGVPSVDELGG